MTPIVILFFLAVASLWAYPKWQAFVERRRFAVDLANVALINGPRLFASRWEGDDPTADAELIKGLLQLCPQRRIGPEHIIVHRFRPHSHSKTALTFEQWRVMVESDFAAICFEYAKKNGIDAGHEFNQQSAN